MSNSASRFNRLVFGDFLEHLRRQEFTIGVEHYLRLQELLNKVGGDCSPFELKTILCPIFATNKKEQDQFYTAFDNYFSFFKSAPVEKEALAAIHEHPTLRFDELNPVTGRKWPYVIGGALTIIFALVLTFPIWPKKTEIEIQPRAEGEQRPSAPQSETGQQPSQVEVEHVEAPSTVKSHPSFYQRYGRSIRLTAIITPLIAFLFYEWYRFNRRKLVLQKQSGKKPPYSWPIQVESYASKLYDSEAFYAAARLMRRRQVGEFHRIDVNATIAATVESLGYPAFRYRPDSEPPEYLVLIDRSSFRDHQAQLFNGLAKALEKEGLFVERYFYDGDPRVCHSEVGDRFHLEQLRDKYPAHRLLVFGDGKKIIDPITGNLETWAALFLEWRNRAVLTPQLPLQWGLKEITLAGQFLLLPATLEGLSVIADHFESTVLPDLRVWQQNGSEHLSGSLDGNDVVDSLRSYLGEKVFQWLCACAVYPELQWDLTLYLGSLPCMPSDIVGEKKLLRLISLPWFRSGVMPDDLRWLLIRELDREKEKSIRRAIIELLEKNPPPKETYAENAYRLNLVVQQWLFHRGGKQRREMLQVLKTLPQSQIYRDYTLLRFLESAATSPLDLFLPRRLRKVFYRDGIPAFGLKTGARLLVTLGAVAIAWILIKPPVSHEQSYQPKNDTRPASETLITPPLGMIYIPGGKFTMGFDGSDDPSEKPEHVETMSPFFIDKTEVTVGDYYKFMEAKNHAAPEGWPQNWKNGNFQPGEDRLPVTGVSWFDAREYAEWAGKRLPTEKEWEYAARGTDKRLYPWGNYFNPAYANVKDSGKNGPVPVGSYSTKTSPFGVMDMAGNVAEWTNSDSFRYPGSQLTPSPGKIVRGGSFFNSKVYNMVTTRVRMQPNEASADLGFRCAKGE